jgi:hypothetical protein
MRRDLRVVARHCRTGRFVPHTDLLFGRAGTVFDVVVLPKQRRRRRKQ